MLDSIHALNHCFTRIRIRLPLCCCLISKLIGILSYIYHYACLSVHLCPFVIAYIATTELLIALPGGGLIPPTLHELYESSHYLSLIHI